MDNPLPSEVALEPLDRERLRRMKAEWELAALHAEVARAALEREAKDVVARAIGARVEAEIDFTAGVIRPRLTQEG